MERIKEFCKRETVLLIALAAAAISCFLVPPDSQYAGYFDLRTLALLYALMAVVAGLRAAGAFDALGRALCRRAGSVRGLGALLVLLCFFSAMLITNDVALLTFVPFAVALLEMAGRRRAIAAVVVLQTVAANLGSMLTPVGNPQNLYLYSRYGFTPGSFFRVTAPVWLVSLALTAALCLALPRTPLSSRAGDAPPLDKKKLALHLVLFAVCLLSVFRVLGWPWMLLVTAAALLAFDRKMLLAPDIPLLITFCAFFVFAGNLARISAVDALLRRLLKGREYWAALASSQVISNVPAALLLSGFTENAGALLLGVNIGGLGTPVASLASLISLKLYSRSPGARTGRYLLLFTAMNGLLLALLSTLVLLMG